MKLDDMKPGQHFIGVTHGMRGWFACEFWINNEERDLDPFLEPWQSDSMSFPTKGEAIIYAKELALALELPYID